MNKYTEQFSFGSASSLDRKHQTQGPLPSTKKKNNDKFDLPSITSQTGQDETSDFM